MGGGIVIGNQSNAEISKPNAPVRSDINWLPYLGNPCYDLTQTPLTTPFCQTNKHHLFTLTPYDQLSDFKKYSPFFDPEVPLPESLTSN